MALPRRWSSRDPRGSCASDVGLRLPMTARGITLPVGPIPPDFMLMPWQTVRGRSSEPLLHGDHSPRTAEPSRGPPLGRMPKGLLMRAPKRPSRAVPRTSAHLRAVCGRKCQSRHSLTHARWPGLRRRYTTSDQGLPFGLTLPTGSPSIVTPEKPLPYHTCRDK